MQPTVHIARSAADNVSNPLLGVFDLTDLADAFSLAQFILGLNTHFQAVMGAASNPKMHTLDWRSDHVPIDDQKFDAEQRLQHWARGIITDR